MDFKNISNQGLISRLEKLAHTERKITHLVLLHIREIDTRKIFLQLGFESLYSYLTKELKYSDSAAYRRIQAMRLLSAVPISTQTQLTEKLESGALNLSQLAQVQSCLKDQKRSGRSIAPQKVSEILQTLEGKNTFDSQKVLAKEFDFKFEIREQIKPQQNDTVRMEVTFTKEQFEALKLAKSLLSHQCPEGQWNEVITLLAEKFSQSRLGKRNANLQAGHKKTNTEAEVAPGIHLTETAKSVASVPQTPPDYQTPQKLQKPTRYRPALSLKVKSQVFQKAQHQCEFKSSATGAQCGSKFQLEIDHRKPLALGGEHVLENLRVLCRPHNQLAWQQSRRGRTTAG